MLRSIKTVRLLEGIYRREPKSGAFLIEISLDKYRDVFNDWDSAYFKNRDLDPDLKNFLENCSADIPPKYPLILQFTLPLEKQSPVKEQGFIQALKNNFKFNIYLLNRQIKHYRKNAMLYSLIAFSFLAIGFLIQKPLHKTIFGSLFAEGLVIGGWVFLWEAFSHLFFKNVEIRQKKKEYKRFHKASIIFIYD